MGGRSWVPSAGGSSHRAGAVTQSHRAARSLPGCGSGGARSGRMWDTDRNPHRHIKKESRADRPWTWLQSGNHRRCDSTLDPARWRPRDSRGCFMPLAAATGGHREGETEEPRVHPNPFQRGLWRPGPSPPWRSAPFQGPWAGQTAVLTARVEWRVVPVEWRAAAAAMAAELMAVWALRAEMGMAVCSKDSQRTSSMRQWRLGTV